MEKRRKKTRKSFNKINKKIKDKRSEGKGNKKRAILFIILVILVLFSLFFDFLLIRNISKRQLDDVNPRIQCDNELFNKSEVLMIIPLFENVSIAKNKTWCENILKLNKTLGMHGVYHEYNEFLELRNESYVRIGMEEFKKCFGFYPSLFEAPQLALSRENEELLREIGFKIHAGFYNRFHKVYHCSDKGKYSNKFTDWV